MADRTTTARAVDITITVLLLLVSAALAVAFFFGGLLWAMDSDPDPLGFGLGVYGPIVVTVIGTIGAIILMARDRSAVWVPFAAMVVSALLWWLGGTLVSA
ncbi:hypothetical protein [Leifsonia sp. Leaf264]|uniref:hypothetical protein n=1 Tax=Leifsonia sp. Leaf264 TaxID=1736314 RepID=UPI0006F97972|nr:hypothetical protein [Leifsonia sp. Leaf264]KQP01257.1 hypothetical protein ASF30_01080 [Leifsonia sp. Leaf264]